MGLELPGFSSGEVGLSDMVEDELENGCDIMTDAQRRRASNVLLRVDPEDGCFLLSLFVVVWRR